MRLITPTATVTHIIETYLKKGSSLPIGNESIVEKAVPKRLSVNPVEDSVSQRELQLDVV